MAVWIFWKILGYEKNVIFLNFWCWKWHPTPNLMILSDRSGIFLISLGGCEPFFVEKSRRNGEKSKFSKNFFWTISWRHMAYVFRWEITYFYAEFQRLTPNSFRVYKGDRQTDRQTFRYIYIYIYIDIYSWVYVCVCVCVCACVCVCPL